MAGEAGREAERESEAARREEEMQARLEALERMLRGQGEALQVQQQLCLEQRERAERLEGELADASMSREAASVGVGSLSLLMLEDAARGRQVAELSARLADAVREAEEAGEGRERERRAAGRERERAEDLVGKLREEGKVRSFQARRVAKLEADMKAARAEERALIETVEQERMRAAQLSVQLEKARQRFSRQFPPPSPVTSSLNTPFAAYFPHVSGPPCCPALNLHLSVRVTARLTIMHSVAPCPALPHFHSSTQHPPTPLSCALTLAPPFPLSSRPLAPPPRPPPASCRRLRIQEGPSAGVGRTWGVSRRRLRACGRRW